MWNFIYVLPITLLVLFMAGNSVLITSNGVLLALVSGAVMLGLGYALWYWVLPQLDVTVGALSQLLMPVFALLQWCGHSYKHVLHKVGAGQV